MKITAVRLRELLHYDPGTGMCTRLVRTCNRIKVGDVAGTLTKEGYLRCSVDNRCYQLHILIWLYMTGEWPHHEIDHRDLDRTNNRWKNLRHATHSQNQANGRAYKNNKSGAKGVYFSNSYGKWAAQISVNGKNIQRLCASREEAINKYSALAFQHFGEFARIS